MASKFEELLDAAQQSHERIAALSEFCAFPDDLSRTPVTPFHIPAADLMTSEDRWDVPQDRTLFDAFVAASNEATWRETYKGTEIGQSFMDQFGCYCLIGPGGAWASDQMRGYVVYMPPGLWYPWHHHPAEELYYVLAGEGEFYKDCAPARTLGAGQASYHASTQSHALLTRDQPVMAYVLWRNGFETPPVLTDPARLESPAGL